MSEKKQPTSQVPARNLSEIGANFAASAEAIIGRTEATDFLLESFADTFHPLVIKAANDPVFLTKLQEFCQENGVEPPTHKK